MKNSKFLIICLALVLMVSTTTFAVEDKGFKTEKDIQHGGGGSPGKFHHGHHHNSHHRHHHHRTTEKSVLPSSKSDDDKIKKYKN